METEAFLYGNRILESSIYATALSQTNTATGQKQQRFSLLSIFDYQDFPLPLDKQKGNRTCFII
tara:strand:+ start:257457 stop:257648 length:192 start_codon:yes stop_codon:yes gene_type:complete